MMMLAVICSAISFTLTGCDKDEEEVVPDFFEFNGITYFINSGDWDTVETYSYAGTKSGNKGSLTIPKYVRYRNISYTVSAIGAHSFAGCDVLSSVAIPNSVTSIGEKAFYNCNYMINVNLPNSLVWIGDNAFLYCSALKRLKLPESLNGIGKNAFDNCSALTTLTIPNSLQVIGDDAFAWCNSLQVINCKIRVPYNCYPGFSDEVMENAILYVPLGTIDIYKNRVPWRYFKNIQEKNFIAD